MIGVIFQYVHVGSDRFEHGNGLIDPAKPAQAHVQPVAGGNQHIRILGEFQALAVGAHCAFEIAIEIIGQAEVVPDIGVRCAGGNIVLVWLAIRLDFIRYAIDELTSDLQIGYGLLEFSDRNMAVATMPQHFVIIRVKVQPRRVNFNRFVVAPQISSAAAKPDNIFRIVRISIERGLRLGQIALQLSLAFGIKCQRVERRAIEAIGFGLFLGDVASFTLVIVVAAYKKGSQHQNCPNSFSHRFTPVSYGEVKFLQR